ncbi:MAG: hypothetical protein M1818_006810 [Claussenomyces sp. TS43310]|nr:MAG: hypothetical protein M1818_006810 [Claussenomyces sp. TS43310]
MAKPELSLSSSSQAKASPFSSLSLLSLALLLPIAVTSTSDTVHLLSTPPRPRDSSAHISERAATTIPLTVQNLCSETVWPAFASQAGTGPNVGGCELVPGAHRDFTVSTDWQGRVWGRTNCSFNAAGTGPSNLNGNNGAGRACGTGDCNGVLSCVVTGDTPVTLAEFDLAGGSSGSQTFYDLSLVDGYNLPIGLTYIPGGDPDLQDIPPNLTDAACIATAGLISTLTSDATNASYPLPYDIRTTNSDLAGWCPWDLQLNKPTKPGDGVYPYPDDSIQRPEFDPCLSACASSNSPSDCCTGQYDSPSACKPSLYSRQAKSVCPDAYSYAFDDMTSTFIIPTGGGWKVTFCPVGRSTNILATFRTQLEEIASTGKVSANILADTKNITLIQKGEGIATHGGERERMKMGSLGALVVMLAWACMW